MATLIAAWLRFCRDTLRWTVEGQDRAEAVWDSDSGAILCVWHATGGRSAKGAWSTRF
eukprot:gene39694-53660_t